MTNHGGESKITYTQDTYISMPPTEEQAYIGVHKYRLAHIQSLLSRLSGKSDNLSTAIYFLLGCGVSGVLTFLSLLSANNLPSYVRPFLVCASVFSFITAGVLGRFRTVRMSEKDDDIKNLNDIVDELLNQHQKKILESGSKGS